DATRIGFRRTNGPSRTDNSIFHYSEAAMNPVNLSQSSLLCVGVHKGFTELCPQDLPVPGGLAIVPNVNQLLELAWNRVDASIDWHPPDHCSFLGRKHNLYPPHCVQGTPGADFLPGLFTDRIHTLWRKGFNADFEAYALTAQHPAFSWFLKACGV